jgi:hypothetical protein
MGGILMVIQENRQVLDLKSKSSEKNLINAVDKYLKLNYCELYNENDLEVIFKKAREDKDMRLKVFNAIEKFILN